MRPGRSSVHWLILRGEDEHATQCGEAYIVDVYNRDGALAVFSFEEEAQMFARSFEAHHDWHFVEVEDRTLLKMLHEDKSSTSFVALDPLPEKLAPEAANLVCVEREYFCHYLLRRVQEQEDTSTNDPCSLTVR